MRSRVHALFTTAFVAAFTLTACGDDGPTGVQGDPLTEAEVQAVLTAVGAVFGSIEGPSSSPAMDGVPGPSAAPVAVEETFSFTADCPLSGSMGAAGALSGTYDDETGDSDLSYELAITHNGCEVMSDDQETSVVVDGDPSLVIDMDTEFSETVFSIAGSYTGGISYTVSDGREGSCSINLNFSISATEGGGAQNSVSGTVCGISGNHFQAYNPTT